MINEIDPAYKVWVFHGENPISTHLENDDEDIQVPDTYRMYRDAYFNNNNVDYMDDTLERSENKLSREEEFRSTLKDVEIPLYPRCTKYTKISALVALYKHKVAHNLSDTSFSELLKLISDVLPPNCTLPKSTSETKKIFKIFDLGDEKILACINDCILFKKIL